MSVSESRTIPPKETLRKFGLTAVFSQNSMAYETPTVVASVWVIEPVEGRVSGNLGSGGRVPKRAPNLPECGEKLSTPVSEVSPDRAQPVKLPVSNPGLVTRLACAVPAKKVASTNAAAPRRVAENMFRLLRKSARGQTGDWPELATNATARPARARWDIVWLLTG